MPWKVTVDGRDFYYKSRPENERAVEVDDIDEYRSFVAAKLATLAPAGLAAPVVVDEWLAPFQRDLVRWALRRGRCAIFAATGLGKTRMELAYAARIATHTGKPTLILAPLAVAPQTVREAALCNVDAVYARDPSEMGEHRVIVTNYERLHRFSQGDFGGVVLDESSIIKHHDAKTLGVLMDAFARTPFRLCATATPSPNDYAELGTHAEFLGLRSRAEMLSEWFCHDGGETQTWRLKRHARAAFWRWVATWGALVRHPRDLGYEDARYDLPPLRIHEHVIAADQEETFARGMLFAEEARGLNDQRAARRATMDRRVAECVALVNASRSPWVVWCDLNAESEALAAGIKGAVEVKGADSIETKEMRLEAFADRRERVMVSKASICGWGLNWQHCSRMAFVGVSHSWEAYYQAVRRCWRFGQTKPVDVHLFTSEAEGAVLSNLMRKDRDAEAMAEELSRETAAIVRESVRGSERESDDYDPRVPMSVPSWIATGDDE